MFVIHKLDENNEQKKKKIVLQRLGLVQATATERWPSKTRKSVSVKKIKIVLVLVLVLMPVLVLVLVFVHWYLGPNTLTWD